MILFELQCAKGHHFEAWFRNGDAYEKQVAGGLINCPTCGNTSITKAPMAPSLLKGRVDAAPALRSGGAEEKKTVSSDAAPMRVMLKALRDHVRSNFDYVGERFPEEARKIHYGESKEHAIYGEANQEEAKELQDEGIPFAILPVLPPDN